MSKLTMANNNSSIAKFSDLLEDNIILTTEGINNINDYITKTAEDYYDIANMGEFSIDEIKAYINKYELPDSSDNEDIIDNLNIDNIKDTTAVKGLIVQRANLRAFPTSKNYYSDEINKDFDAIQESELLVNTPVIIIHESKDKEWNFVISPFYLGWVQKDNIAVASDEDWKYYLNKEEFVVITDNVLTVDDISLDMSVTLPLIKEDKMSYQVALPTKDKEGNLVNKVVEIDKDKAHNGFLEYTKRNLLEQAFKYEGTTYSWSGLNEGVDCSSFISNVYRTFGFYFPRNTSSQKESIESSISLEDKSIAEKRKIIQNNSLSLLYQPGHVMLYLETVDNEDYIIHASGKQLKVVVSKLEDSDLENIDKIININISSKML